MSFVSSKGNILCWLIKIELYKIFAIINRAIKGLHCISNHDQWHKCSVLFYPKVLFETSRNEFVDKISGMCNLWWIGLQLLLTNSGLVVSLSQNIVYCNVWIVFNSLRLSDAYMHQITNHHWHQANSWSNAGILLIQTLGTNFSENWSKRHIFSFKKMHSKMLSVKW